LEFNGYWSFDKFAVEEFRTFWKLFVEWSGVPFSGPLEPVCEGEACETARFFPGVGLNYAEVVLADVDEHGPAIWECRANGTDVRIGRVELRRRVTKLAAALRRLDIGPGDRVAAITRNRSEAVVAMLAAAAIGAVFSSCAPDAGAHTILARLGPIAPKLLFAHVEPEPWDAGSPVSDRVAEVVEALNALEYLILLDADRLDISAPVRTLSYSRLLDEPEPSDFSWDRFPFGQPLCILFSSGTTGAPKCIVHTAGGTLIEHLKEHRLHCDLGRSDRLYFHTSCAWMMWNWQLSALASGTEIVLYDGPVQEPDVLWKLVERCGVTVFGTSPAYLQLCERAALSPRTNLSLTSLRSMLSTGSILHERQFDWIREHVKDVPVQSISGGTDILGCFVIGNPILPVHRGEAQCRSLGLDVRSLTPSEETSSIGELICANPFPSRPVGFFGDDAGTAFRQAYFSQHPPFWTHGDLVEFSAHGGVRLHGRTDGVLNVRGIRIGPSEIYRILQTIDEVVEAVAVDQADAGHSGGGRLLLFVVLKSGTALTSELVGKIRNRLARDGSPAHVPAECLAVPELPITLSGKRSEAAVQDVVDGREARNREALRNPASLEAIRHALSAAASEAQRMRHDLVATPLDDGGLRDGLCRLVSNTLGTQVGPTDNILDFGADSLTLVLLAAEISKFLGTEVAGGLIFSAPTVEALLRSLASGEAVRDGASSDLPKVRAAMRADFDEISTLLDRGFRDDRIAWSRIFDYTWVDARPDFGFVLVAEGRVVGFLGTVYSRAPSTAGRAAWVCNLSSWFVQDAYRGWGSYLLWAATRRTDTIYTSITPTRETQSMLKTLRYRTLDRQRFFLPLLNPGTFRLGRLTIETDPARIRPHLGESDRTILDDHASCDLLHMLAGDDRGSTYLIAKRRLLSLTRTLRVPTSELLYCSDADLLTRNLERLKIAILWRQRSLLLAAHEGYVPDHIRSARRAHGERYASASEAELENYLLYSELALLPV
jgi:acetoacetyl-CoA synthetase